MANRKSLEVEVASEELQITEPVLVDESIELFEYYEYGPSEGNNINNNQDIVITIQGEDEYLCPSKSYLCIEGRLTKADADRSSYEAEDRVTLVNNAMAYLFSQIRFYIYENEIENISFPGQASTMKGLLLYSNDFGKAEGLGRCWQKDTSTDTVIANNLGFAARRSLIIAKPNPRGTFSFCIPLKHLFGFCRDYKKVIYGVKYKLFLSRQNDDDAIYRDGTTVTAAGKITLTKLSWYMPKAVIQLPYLNDLTKLIMDKVSLEVAYRSMQCAQRQIPVRDSDTWEVVTTTGTELPRWLVVGFQTGKAADQTQNPAIFDNVGLTKISVTINGKRYPDTDRNSNFTSYTISAPFQAMIRFKEDYLGVPNEESSQSISPIEFVELYPIHVIDMRRYPAKMKDTAKNIVIQMKFSTNVPVGTVGYALLISERKFFLDSDGKRFRMATN